LGEKIAVWIQELNSNIISFSIKTPGDYCSNTEGTSPADFDLLRNLSAREHIFFWVLLSLGCYGAGLSSMDGLNIFILSWRWV
jgi:hypothetical protein